MNLLELFVNVDDFCQIFLPIWEKKLISDGSKQRRRTGQFRISEIMTILIYFHQSQYRNFKAYYIEHVCKHLRSEFPNLVFIRMVFPLTLSLKKIRLRWEETSGHVKDRARLYQS